MISYDQCPDEIVLDKSTSTTLRNTPPTYKHDSAGSFSITGNQLNRVYVRARDYAKLYWSTCPVLFRPDTGYDICNRFTVKLFPLRQSVILTTSFFFARDSTYTHGHGISSVVVIQLTLAVKQVLYTG
jgi:hypothetical protein